MKSGIIPVKKKRPRWLWPAGALFLCAAFLLLVRNITRERVDPLSATERAWLKAHPVIRLAPDPVFPPVEYLDRNGGYNGITADYVSLIEKKLGIRFEIVHLRNWDEIISKAKSRQIDLYVATKTPQRAEYMLFTKPFLEFPVVIIAREKVKGHINLEKLNGMKVSVVSEYAAQNFISYNYPKLNLDLVPDVQTGLRKVSFGLSDAFVENLATATYYIEKEGITNLRIAGESGYFYRMGFCSRKDWPELNSFLEKGLAGISTDEKKGIYKKWIPLEPSSLFTSKELHRGLLVALTAILMIIAGIIAWNRSLARQVRLRTRELDNELAERSMVEEKLRFTQFAVDNTIDQAFWMTEDGRLFYVNDAACRTLGYSREELIGMSIPDIDPCHPTEVFARHWRDLRENGSVTMESFHRAKDGRVYPVEIRANHVVFDGREYNCAFATDISERKRAEDALRESEEKFRVLAETTPAAICLFQGEHNVYVNSSFSRLTGYTERECLEMKFWDWMHEDFRELARQRGMARQRGEAVPTQYELKFVTKSGEEKWAFLSGGCIEYGGKPSGIVTIFDITERKLMEEELERARDELEKRVEERTAELAETVQALLLSRFCIDKAAIGIYHTTFEGSILGANEFACRSLGYTADELCALKVPDIDPVITQEKSLEIKRMLDTTGSVTHETVHRRKDGTTFPVEIVTNSLEFQGKSYGFSFVKDITERKRAEEALRESEARLKMAMDIAMLVQWEYDVRSGMFTFDDQFYALYGTTAEREGGTLMSAEDYVRKFIPSEEAAMVAEYIAEEPANPCFQLEHRIICADGEERFIVVRSETVRDESGCIVKTRGANQDITERKRAEKALREANLVVENSPVVLFRWKGDDEWPVELVSGNVIQFGYTPDEFLSGAIIYSSIIHPHDLERVTREVHDFCNEGADRFRLEYRIMTRGGDIRWVNEHTNVERDAAGGVKNFEGIVIDVTERKLAEEQLQLQKQQLEELNSNLEQRVGEEVRKNREKDIMLIQQNRQAALGEMLDHIAHQWKQPLNSISLIVQNLEETASDGELTNEHVEETVGKTMALLDHMAQTIEVFRGFYRPDKEKRVFSIKDTIDQALAFIAPALRFHSVMVELDVDPGLTAFGYPKEYTQVLLNILANAKDVFKARGTEKPRVIIRAFAEDDKAVVTITDNAGGISEAIKGKIFDFYFTTNESGGGTGIGLYMSKNIIEKNMGGTLSAENTDGGAQFRIEISPT
jgi:PAS domain S-box-containing protein